LRLPRSRCQQDRLLFLIIDKRDEAPFGFAYVPGSQLPKSCPRADRCARPSTSSTFAPRSRKNRREATVYLSFTLIVQDFARPAVLRFGTVPEEAAMIEGIAGIGAVAIATPSAGHAVDRRRKRLKWLSSLRTTLGEAGPLVDEMGDNGADITQTRAQITDALDVVEEMRVRLGGVAGEAAGDASGRTITAADLARRIAVSADRSLAAQAHVGAAAVRRYVGGEDENPR
jgi:hypothetical protein